MNRQTGNTEFDAIVVGSGAGGATVARELSKRGQRVLILERGGNAPLKDGLLAFVSIMNAASVGENLAMGRAFTTGGTTAAYFASTVYPPLEIFLSLGIDLSKELDEAGRELPLATLPDEYLRPQTIRARESALALGYEWRKARMLVDQSKCTSGYSYDAKWTARDYVREAVEGGAVLVNRAKALRVLVEGGRAIGVEYELRKTKKEVEVCQAFGSKIILATGGAATPLLLQKSGIKNVAGRGFHCHPSFLVVGAISGLKGRNGFGGIEGLTVDENIHVGDANFDRTFFKLIMLGQRKWMRAFSSFATTIALGVMVRDSAGGGLQADGRYYKQFTKEDLGTLGKAEDVAHRIIQHAGGKILFKSSIGAGVLSGAVRIKEHVDEKLETEYANLHVCDGSVLPGEVNAPTLTLICLGKYLAKQLAHAA